ncbi:sialidase family protein [Paracoccus zhejiangensis]|uniref:Glycosyl hydrolase n=1 Tax=Paracoccus zhejiangensis TaxID=1077935 RepID=A0A2H5F0F7_9RHOB|nr:exo-alpha-sialidase [Paracoccus zhejiangensis]AUH65039.1 glycosyl hydrolase [Paracoccus zhejiangensis]
MTVDEIAASMDGRLATTTPGRDEAFLPSPAVQNHASFLVELPDGAVICTWFGGSLEGKSDISIRAAILLPGATQWGPVSTLSDDPDHSEQNPVIFPAPDGQLWLFHTSQPSGNQDECRVRMARLTREGDRLRAEAGAYIDLPRGCFIRAQLQVQSNGSWLLPLFRCVQRPGQKWTGSHDVAAVAISPDQGKSWSYQEVPGSVGSVHMCPVDTGARLSAFYRRRQADFVCRSDSLDGGRSWSAPVATDVPNNNSSLAATRLASGQVALICNPINAEMSPDRRASLYDELGEEDGRPDADPQGGCTPIWGVPRAPAALCLSTDGGASFPERYLIEDGDGACLSNNSLDGKNHELSYPWLLETTDGALHLSYTFHRRAIKHVRLAPGWRERLTRL